MARRSRRNGRTRLSEGPGCSPDHVRDDIQRIIDFGPRPLEQREVIGTADGAQFEREAVRCTGRTGSPHQSDDYRVAARSRDPAAAKRSMSVHIASVAAAHKY